MSDIFSLPDHVSQLDPAVFQTLHREFPNTSPEGIWRRNGEHDNPRLVYAMGMVVDDILTRELEMGQSQPDEIELSAQTTPVAPDQSQRHAGTHSDHRDVNFTAASSFPTTFFVGSETLGIDSSPAAQRSQRRASRSIQESVEKGIVSITSGYMRRNGLAVYMPEPGELVAFGKQLHKSTANRSPHTTERAWMRAGFDRKT